MKKTEFFFPSANGVNDIHAVRFEPDEKPKAIVQIVHGMTEYADRYSPFASFLAEHGFLVVGDDHLGHGLSVKDESELGFFGQPDGNEYLLDDLHELQKETQKEFPGIPYFFLGHSMGSFLTRQYISLYGESLAGAVIMGTGFQPGAVLFAGKTVCRVIALFKGWHYRSKFVDSLSVGAYNKRFQPIRTKSDWLSPNEQSVDEYIKDPLCGFLFTVNGYHQMFRSIGYADSLSYIRSTPVSLPVLLISGKDDPVGNFGKGVERVRKLYQKVGTKDLKELLYPGDRHEILNGMNREQVFSDLLMWFEKRI